MIIKTNKGVIFVKKTISLLLVISLFLCNALVLTGCSSDKKNIIGTWQADINYAAAVNAGIYSADGMEDMGDYFKFDEFYLTTTFTFFEDGTYTVELDSTSVFNAVHGIRGHMSAGMRQYLADEIKKAGLDVSVDSYLVMLGLNWITLGEMLLTDYTLGQIADELNRGTKGFYRVEKGKIYMTAGTDEDLTEENYDTYTLDGNTLILTECHCQQEEGFENISQEIYPLVLTRTEE